MNADQPSGQNPAAMTHGNVNANVARWAELLAEMSALHAKLEYMSLMLRLNSQRPPSDA